MASKQQPAHRKHIPERTCVICRQKKDKRSLTRVVSIPDNGIHIDPTGKQNGRGAYLCDSPECWQRATTSDQLGKALRTILTEDDRERIQAAMPHPE